MVFFFFFLFFFLRYTEAKGCGGDDAERGRTCAKLPDRAQGFWERCKEYPDEKFIEGTLCFDKTPRGYRICSCQGDIVALCNQCKQFSAPVVSNQSQEFHDESTILFTHLLRDFANALTSEPTSITKCMPSILLVLILICQLKSLHSGVNCLASCNLVPLPGMLLSPNTKKLIKEKKGHPFRSPSWQRLFVSIQSAFVCHRKDRGPCGLASLSGSRNGRPWIRSDPPCPLPPVFDEQPCGNRAAGRETRQSP